MCDEVCRLLCIWMDPGASLPTNTKCLPDSRKRNVSAQLVLERINTRRGDGRRSVGPRLYLHVHVYVESCWAVGWLQGCRAVLPLVM